MLDQNLIIISVSIFAGILVFWLVIITYQLFSLRHHYKMLVGKTNKKDLQSMLKHIITIQEKRDQTIEKIHKHLETLEKAATFHLQYIGFKRFNPFNDTGGDQSFVLSLLDEHKNGMVFSSLHNRDRTRLYAKEIIKGHPKDIELSDEEKEVVAKATRIGA